MQAAAVARLEAQGHAEPTLCAGAVAEIWALWSENAGARKECTYRHG